MGKNIKGYFDGRVKRLENNSEFSSYFASFGRSEDTHRKEIYHRFLNSFILHLLNLIDPQKSIQPERPDI